MDIKYDNSDNNINMFNDENFFSYYDFNDLENNIFPSLILLDGDANISNEENFSSINFINGDIQGSYNDNENNPYLDDVIPIIPSYPKENLYYTTISLRKKQSNKKIDALKNPLKKFKSNEIDKFVEYNITKSIEYLKNKVPFHLYTRKDNHFDYFGSVIDVKKNLSHHDKTKILLIISADGIIFNKISDANKYLKKKLNKENQRFIASVYYECDENKKQGSNSKKLLSKIFCQYTKQGKKIAGSPDIENGEKISYEPIKTILPLKCTYKNNSESECECKRYNTYVKNIQNIINNSSSITNTINNINNINNANDNGISNNHNSLPLLKINNFKNEIINLNNYIIEKMGENDKQNKKNNKSHVDKANKIVPIKKRKR